MFLQKQIVGCSGVWAGIHQSAETQREELSDRRNSCATQKKHRAQLLSQPSLICHWFNTNSLRENKFPLAGDGYLIPKLYGY